ncbi:MAG: homoserine dehydrogenase [Clostridia bacterium]|nr:homoserine dehydrogenase [Clostridia bacterium]
MVYTAIMGHGTVGSGVAQIMIGHESLVKEKIKDDIEVKYILDLRDFERLPYSDKFIKDFNIILNDDDVKIVVEVMGGINPAFDFVKACLEKGKSVVTSNKELVAAKGAELLKIAEEKNVNFLFEASVGGAIPILRPMAQCLAANDIYKITGILNGTTNFILNKMIVDNTDFDVALKLAQEKGYAERNPESDIEGLDACRKICILASLGFGKHVYPSQVKTEGISNITLKDVEYADNFGYVIKLICYASKNKNGTINAYVRPTLVSKDNILSSVNGVYNAIMVTGDACDNVMFYGRGAGKMPTASAVVADVIDCAKHLTARKFLSWSEGNDGYVENGDEKTALYILAKSENYDKLCLDTEKIFGKDIAVIKNKYSNEIAFITGTELNSVLEEKIKQLNADSIKCMHILI